MARELIVNADDFGLSEGVNRGIIEAAERGIVTSASLMVRQPGAAAAAAYSREQSPMSIGLHLDLGEWVFQSGEWVPLYTVVPTDNAAAVSKEISRQLSEFRRLLGRDPTHIDSHQHVHRHEPVRELVLALGADLGLPVRDLTPGITYCGDFYGQGAEGESLDDILTIGGLTKILQSIPDGVTELGCHPGYGRGLATAYRDERVREIAVLCAPEIRAFLKTSGIVLRRF